MLILYNARGQEYWSKSLINLLYNPVVIIIRQFRPDLHQYIIVPCHTKAVYTQRYIWHWGDM